MIAEATRVRCFESARAEAAGGVSHEEGPVMGGSYSKRRAGEEKLAQGLGHCLVCHSESPMRGAVRMRAV